MARPMISSDLPWGVLVGRVDEVDFRAPFASAMMRLAAASSVAQAEHHGAQAKWGETVRPLWPRRR